MVVLVMITGSRILKYFSNRKIFVCFLIFQNIIPTVPLTPNSCQDLKDTNKPPSIRLLKGRPCPQRKLTALAANVTRTPVRKVK